MLIAVDSFQKMSQAHPSHQDLIAILGRAALRWNGQVSTENEPNER
jgi:hypothetical protein